VSQPDRGLGRLRRQRVLQGPLHQEPVRRAEGFPGRQRAGTLGQELRVSIRGSAIARAFHGRGVDILQDGISFNNADGSGDYYQIDPLALRAIEIYKGGNGLAYGSSYLAARSTSSRDRAHRDCAFHAGASTAELGTLQGNNPGVARVGRLRRAGECDFSHQNGYRDHSLSDYQHYNGNFGYRINANVETRFYTGIYNTDQKLPGSLSLTDALNNPTMAAPTAKLGDQRATSGSSASPTAPPLRVESGKVDLDTWAMHKTLVHPIFQVIDQDGWTYGSRRNTRLAEPRGLP